MSERTRSPTDRHADGVDAALASIAADVPAPHRNDAAFARSVAADVATRRNRQRLWWGIPGLAATAAAIAFVVTGATSDPGVSTTTPSTPTTPTSTTPTMPTTPTTPTTPSTVPAPLALHEVAADIDDEDLVLVDDATDETLLALADVVSLDDDTDLERDTFTFGALDGSTEQELRQLEAALDKALAL